MCIHETRRHINNRFLWLYRNESHSIFVRLKKKRGNIAAVRSSTTAFSLIISIHPHAFTSISWLSE